MTNVFAVVGEHKKDQARLLLKGDDGCYYAYGNRHGEVESVRPGKDWTLDSTSTKSPAENNEQVPPPA